MRHTNLLLIIVLVFLSCGEETKKELFKESVDKTSILDEENEELSTDDVEKSLELLGGFLKGDDEETTQESESGTSETSALEQLLELSGSGSKGGNSADMLQNMLNSTLMLDLLAESGVSREDLEKLINNPDSLKVLANEAMKNPKVEKQEKKQKKEWVLKGKLSNEELASKNTPTGVSLEEAILLVMAESGPEATMAKLKKVDSLTGQNTMENLDFNQASYVMTNVERENEIPASAEEEKKIATLKKLSIQLHSVSEAKELQTELEQTEKDIASGKLKTSPKYQRAISRQKNIVKSFNQSFRYKNKTAKAKFIKLNPNLYFGEEAGDTYISDVHKAVYLPLGKLSFADKVVKVNHPLMLTQDVNNVLGEPDVIKGFLPEDITGIHSLGLGGTLTVQFIDNALTDVNGPDLYIFEIGAVEPTNLEISKDGKQWIKVGKIDGGVAEVDIAPFVKRGELYYYVRLKDLKSKSGLPGADVDAIATIGAAMRLNLDSKVLFETGKSVLKPEGLTAIKKLAEDIAILKKGNVIVEGHTDNVGSTQTNQKLSLARAKSVSAELKKLIPSSGFKWKETGFGESKPLVDNDSDENRQKNRRVEILILPN